MASSTHARSPADSVCLIDISLIARALRFVSFTNYCMLVVCGWIAVGCITALFGSQTAPAFALNAALAAVYGFAAWVGWRNIGVLGAVIHPYTKPALFILSLSSALLVLGMWPDLADDRLGEDVFVGLLVIAFVALVAIGGLLALVVLDHSRIPGIGVSLRAFLRQSLAAQEAHKAHRLPAASPRKGILFALLGAAWLLVIELIPTDVFPAAIRGQVWFIAQGGYVLLIYARQYFQPSFATVRAGDKRQPVLFLRSFADDEKLSYSKAASALFDFSLESRLAAHFNSVGPFIAVGAPGKHDPQIGAARLWLNEDQWQGTVLGWMGEAAIIVAMAGTTHWAVWELDKLVALEYAAKLIVIFPQAKTASVQRKDSGPRLMTVCQAFAGSPWEAELAALKNSVNPTSIRSLGFRAGGRIVCVTSRPRNRESYHLAALISHYMQLQDRGEIAAAHETQPMNWLRSGAAAAVLIGALLLGAANFQQLVPRLNRLLGQGPLDPLPSSIPVETNGALRVGNFKFVEQRGGAARAATYRRGEKVGFSYDIEGFKMGADGCPNVEIEATLLDATGARVSDTSATRFHKRIHEGLRINSWFGWTLKPAARGDDYRIEVKVHDAVADTDLTFKPQFHYG
jgi:hypothetical protein